MSDIADPTALALEEHGSFVIALARSLTIDEHEANDVVQETWLTTMRSRPSRDRSLKPWLARVVKRAAWTRERSSRRRAVREETAAKPEATTEDLAQRLEIQQKVVECVLDLDEPYRSVVLLGFYDELSPREIAERLDIPLETVRTRKKRALARLRSRLDRGEVGETWFASLAALVAANPLQGGSGAGAAPVAGSAGLTATWKSALAGFSALGLPAKVTLGACGVLLALVAMDLRQEDAPFLARGVVHAGDGGGGVDSGPPAPVLADPGPEAQARVEVHDDPLDLYWREVVRRRVVIPRFAIEEHLSPMDGKKLRAIRATQVSGIHVHGEVSLRQVLAPLFQGTEFNLVVHDDAEVLVKNAPTVADFDIDMPLVMDQALDFMLAQFETDGQRIGWTVRGEFIHVGLASEVAAEPIRFEYAIGDLVVDPASFFAEGAQTAGPNERPLFHPYDVERLLEQIVENVAVETWGYGRGSIDFESLEEGQAFVVDQAPLVHEKIQSLLDYVRAFHAPVETRSPGEAVGLHFEERDAAQVLERLEQVKFEPRLASADGGGLLLEQIAFHVMRDTGLNVLVSQEVRRAPAEERSIAYVGPEQTARQLLDALVAGLPNVAWVIRDGMVQFVSAEEATGNSHGFALIDVRDLLDPGFTLSADAVAGRPRLAEYFSPESELDDELEEARAAEPVEARDEVTAATDGELVADAEAPLEDAPAPEPVEVVVEVEAPGGAAPEEAEVDEVFAVAPSVNFDADNLDAFVRASFEPESWDREPAFSLRVASGVLELRQSPRLHANLADWLERLFEETHPVR